MLHPFLFIGVGGSGGKTLRTVRADLERRLTEVDYTGPWPSCWQLLHIDVPTDADGNEPDLPGQLEEKDYRGLVGRKITYDIIDDSLAGRAEEAVLRNLIGWRPDPRRIAVPVEKGAGQFRALGRAIVVANLATVADALDGAIQALQGPEMTADLNRVSRKFNVAVADTPAAPAAVVISSLAGGSGSGAFLDICDTLRAVGGAGYADSSYAVLYAPDVFKHLPEEARRGVNANALAALCELMNGFWDVDPRPVDAALVQSKAKRAFGSANRRGPKFPFIVGTRNDRVSFGHQNEVYRAMGKALAAWTVSEHLQGDIGSYAVGNWGQSNIMPDHTRLKNGDQQQTLCSIGFGRVTLGRDNFADYASQRIARRAVDRILRHHLAERPPEADPNHEVAIEEIASSRFEAFLQESGLDERGEKDQILDALRPVDRDARINASIEKLRSTVVAGRSQATPAHQWRMEAIDNLQGDRGLFADDETTQRNLLGREWVKVIEQRLVRLVARTVAAYGAPVTDRLLAKLRAEIEFVLTELPDEQVKHARWADMIDQAVSGVLAPSNDALLPDNPAIAEAISKGVDCYDHSAEADLRGFATDLLKDLLHNLIVPLHNATRNGKELLALREVGTASEPSEVNRWPEHDLVPRRFQPANNEFLLEPVEQYPEIYRRLTVESSSADDPGGAEAEFVRHAIVGSTATDRDAQHLIRIHTSWMPAMPELHAAYGSSARAQFELETSPDHILDRARQLVTDHDSPIGLAVGESLKDFLSQEKVDPAELARRKNRFNDAFGQALATSKPLVSIDPQALSRIHERDSPGINYLFTEIPFPEGTPGFEIVQRILQNQGQLTADVQSAFGEGDQSRIDVFSMLGSSYNPMVFESLMGPIADEWSDQCSSADRRDGFWRWRRARPLAGCIPVSSEVRLSMIRGWFTARVLGRLQFDAVDRSVMSIWQPSDRTMVPFPNPLLGAAVHQDYERLPAVLESLPIALTQYVEQGPRGDRSLAPYWCLLDLGYDARGASHDYESVNAALDTWIVQGTVATGAPEPKAELAGPAGGTTEAALERQERCLLTVQDWMKRYGDLIGAPVTLGRFYGVARVVEIGADVTEALEELEQALTQVVAVASSGEW